MGFLVKECLASGVELIKDVNYEESMWIKMKGEAGILCFWVVFICLQIVKMFPLLKVVTVH